MSLESEAHAAREKMKFLTAIHRRTLEKNEEFLDELQSLQMLTEDHEETIRELRKENLELSQEKDKLEKIVV